MLNHVDNYVNIKCSKVKQSHTLTGQWTMKITLDPSLLVFTYIMTQNVFSEKTGEGLTGVICLPSSSKLDGWFVCRKQLEHSSQHLSWKRAKYSLKPGLCSQQMELLMTLAKQLQWLGRHVTRLLLVKGRKEGEKARG